MGGVKYEKNTNEKFNEFISHQTRNKNEMREPSCKREYFNKIMLRIRVRLSVKKHIKTIFSQSTALNTLFSPLFASSPSATMMVKVIMMMSFFKHSLLCYENILTFLKWDGRKSIKMLSTMSIYIIQFYASETTISCNFITRFLNVFFLFFL